MQFIDLLLVRWIFWGQIGHKNYEDFEHPTRWDKKTEMNITECSLLELKCQDRLT